ncbi:hypothetical protein [Frankia tisae]|uniref:hypothetical protein n=1 Tax=Frankia tisae TaxID=2950104 RepID=UPI0021C183E3|nr:hypothetical protein [Frankia tisae]
MGSVGAGELGLGSDGGCAGGGSQGQVEFPALLAVRPELADDAATGPQPVAAPHQSLKAGAEAADGVGAELVAGPGRQVASAEHADECG